MKMPESNPHSIFIERLLIVAAFGLILWLLWFLRQLLMVAMGAVVLAVLLRSIGRPIERFTGLGTRASSLIAVLVFALVLAAFGYLFGAELGSQLANLREALPRSWHDFQQQVAGLPMGRQILETLNDGAGVKWHIADIVVMVTDAAGTLMLIFFGSIFFAVQPELYTAGLLMLLPKERRPLVGEAMSDAGRALRLWLLGQLISMTAVGILTGVGLWLAGVPSPVALGLIAGLTEGIPYLGPIIGSVPGLLMGLLNGPETMLWALVVYVAVQQIEGNTLVPVIHREMVTLPPALTLFSIIAAGLIFGVIGLVFATPMLLVIYVLVKRLYVVETLNTYTPVPGEKQDGAEKP